VGGVIGRQNVLPRRRINKREAAPNQRQLMAAHPVQVREAVPASPPQLSRPHPRRVHQTQDVQRDRVGKVPDPDTLAQPSATRAILSKEIGSGMGGGRYFRSTTQLTTASRRAPCVYRRVPPTAVL